MKKHRNILYALVFILLALQTISFIFMSAQLSKLDVKINSLSSNLQKTEKNLTSYFTTRLNFYDEENQRNINQLSLAIAVQTTQQKDFEKEISLLKTTQDDFSGIVEEVVKSVVAVMTENSVGSGFIITSDGFIVTNYHVVQQGGRIRVLPYGQSPLYANITGIDETRDLALLKINGNYNFLQLADSSELQVGKKVIAIGNPLGLSFTVTEGIISGLHRAGPNSMEEYVQTDVSLNPGNSGGPLINTEGKVVGINNFKIGGAESLGFALESNSIRNSINKMLKQELIA